MKIVCIDNLNRDTHDDKLVCENVSKFYGGIIVKALNDKLSSDHGDDYFVLAEDDYILYKYEW